MFFTKIQHFSTFQLIKVRDASDFVFNYTANVDQRNFEVMRNEQCLDIDFREFKTNLLDMLQQVQHQEMYKKLFKIKKLI